MKPTGKNSRQAMACVRRARLDLFRQAFSKIQLLPQQWSSGSPEWYQNLGSTSLKTFQNGKRFLRYRELLLSHKFYLTDSSPSEDKEEENTLPELSKSDETPEKKKWELVDAAREMCQILEKGHEDTAEALTQLGVQLTPRLVKMVLDKTVSKSSILRFLQWAKTQPRFEDDNSAYDKTDEAPEKKKWKLTEARREICQVVRKGEEDMEVALTQLGVQVTPQLVNLVFVQINSPSSALRFFQWAKLQPGFKHYSSTYDRLTNILGRFKDFEALLRILSERSAVRCYCSAKTFSFAAAWHDDLDLLNEIMQMLEKLELPVRRSAYEMLIVALCEENHINAALVVLENMARSGCAPSMQTYRPLLQVYCLNNQMDKVYEVFGRMKDYPQDPISYHIVLNTLCDRKQFAKAVEFLQRMVSTGYPPDAIVYDITIRAVCNLGSIQSALRLFDRLKEEGITPLSFTYRHILNALLQIRGFDEAHSFLIQHIGKNRELDSSNYRYLIRVCNKLGQEQAARNLTLEMKAKGFA